MRSFRHDPSDEVVVPALAFIWSLCVGWSRVGSGTGVGVVCGLLAQGMARWWSRFASRGSEDLGKVLGREAPRAIGLGHEAERGRGLCGRGPRRARAVSARCDFFSNFRGAPSMSEHIRAPQALPSGINGPNMAISTAGQGARCPYVCVHPLGAQSQAGN